MTGEERILALINEGKEAERRKQNVAINAALNPNASVGAATNARPDTFTYAIINTPNVSAPAVSREDDANIVEQILTRRPGRQGLEQFLEENRRDNNEAINAITNPNSSAQANASARLAAAEEAYSGIRGITDEALRAEIETEYANAIDNYKYVYGKSPYKETFGEVADAFGKAAVNAIPYAIDWADATVSKAATGLASGITGTVDALVSPFIRGAGNIVGQDWSNNPISQANEVAKGWDEASNQRIKEFAKGDPVLTGVTNLGASGLQMLLPYGVSKVFSAIANTPAALQTISSLANAPKTAQMANTVLQMVKNPNYITAFVQETGNNYNEAKSWAKNDDAAAAYALTVGALNAGLEVGLDAKSGIQGMEDNLLNGDGSLFKLWLNTSKQESIEELTQGITSRAASGAFGKEIPIFSFSKEAVLNPETMVKEAAASFVLSAILSAGNIISSDAFLAPNQQTPSTPSQTSPSPTAPVLTPETSVNATTERNGTQSVVEPLTRSENAPVPTKVKVTKRPKSTTGDAFVDAIANGVAPQANAEAETETAPPAEGSDGLGAANAGFASTPFNEWRDSTNVEHEMGEKAARYVGLPKKNLQGKNTMKTGQSVMETANIPDARVAQIENAYVNGKLSYLPTTNAEQIEKAKSKIADGWDSAKAEWHKTVGAGGGDADTVALGATLLMEAANYGMSDAEFMDIMYDYADLAHRVSGATQALRILKTLTPEGKLYGIQKTVQNLNKNLPKRRASKNDPNNIPVANWAEKAGDQLADSMLKVNIKGANTKTVVDTVVSDIKTLIKQNSPSMQTKKSGRSATDRAVDYLNNNEFYDEVMQTVKTRLADAYGEATAAKLFADWYDKSVSSLMLGNYGKQGITLDPALIAEYRNAADDVTRDKVIKKMQQNIADQIPSTLFDKWTALRYVNMLGNFKTQERNLGGNAGMMVLRAVKNEINTAVEGLVSAATGGKIERTSSAFVGKEWMDATKRDFADYEDEVLNGSKYNDKSFTNKFERGVEKKRTIFKNNGTWGTSEASGIAASLPVKAARKAADVLALGMEGYRRGTNRAIEKGDLAFSKHHYARALAGYLKANGVSVQAFESGNVDPALLDRARNYAIKEAQEATFRDDNAFSNWASGALRGENTPKALKAIGEGIAPFRKTPANVFVRFFEYSPAGILDTAYKAAKAGKADSDITASDVINSLSKTLTGTGLFVLGAILRNKGWLRGGIDEDDREIAEINGEQEYSLVLPNGKSYTIDWLAPASITLFTGANLADVLSDNGANITDVWDAVTSLTEPMLTMSMLSGVDDALGSIKYSDNDLLQLALTASLGYVTQGLTNTMLGQLERTFEPNRMTTYTEKQSVVPEFLQKTIGKATAKIPIPGVDYQQTEDLDNFGNTESNGDVFERIVTNFISPSYVKEAKKDPLVEALTEIHYATGEDPFPSGKAPNSYTIDGEKYTLTQADKEQYIKTAGNTYTKYADIVLGMDASVKRKGEILSAINEYATAIAKKEYYSKIGKEYELPNTAKMVQRAIDTGMDLGRWFKAREQYDVIYDEDLKPSEKVKKFDKWLNSQDFTFEEKKAIRATMSYYWQINARK